MKVKTNLVSGIIFVVLGGILLLLMPSQIVVASIIPFLESAKAAPLLAIIIMTVGGTVLIIQSVFLGKEQVVEVHFAEQKYALFVIATIIGYAGLIFLLGYIIASIAMVFVLYRFYQIRNVFQLGIALAIAVGIFFLFTKIFNVSLPGLGGILF
jgi:putative tricarboxylic transport membrane protein